MIGKAYLCSKPLSMHPTEAGKFFSGDLAYVFRREIMQRNMFPIFPGEKFVPELYVWNRIGDAGEVLYFPGDVVYRAEYLADGYTANFHSHLRQNPNGFGLFYRTQVTREASLLQKTKFVVRSIQCCVYAFVKWLKK